MTPKVSSPSSDLMDRETEHLLLSFCTFCTMLKGKKLSLQNVFLLVLQDELLRDMLKELLTTPNNFELVRLFIDFDPSITRSKYVTKFLNANPNVRL
jgi:hypothetical protein